MTAIQKKAFRSALNTAIDKLDRQGYDLAREIERLHKTGVCSAAPPIFGAMTRLSLSNDERLDRAYQIVQERKAAA